MDDTYSIKEVIEDKFEEMGKHLIAIKEQTTKTNGRVTSLESSRTKVWTAIAVLSILGGGIISLSVAAINGKIKEGIHEALATYNVEVHQ